MLAEGGYKRGGRGDWASRSQRFWLRQVPISWRRQKACGWMLSLSSSPLRPGDCPSFYRPRRSSLQACRTVLAMCNGMAYSATEWTTVLANPASGGASWCALCPPKSGFEGGGVEIFRWVVVHTLTRGCGWREDVGRTAAGVAVSCCLVPPQRRGWHCSARDGVAGAGTAAQDRWRQRRRVPLAWRHGIVLGKHGIGVRPPFRGFRRPLSRAWRVSRTRVGGTVLRNWHRHRRTASYSGGDGLTGGVGGTSSRCDSQACQRRDVDSSLAQAPANVRALNAPVGGAGMGAVSPWGPRARWNLTREGDRPSSEVDPHPRGHPALERGGSLLVRCRAPRAKRSSARGWLGQLSGGPPGPPGSWARLLGRELS
jgi:hypothetical protein